MIYTEYIAIKDCIVHNIGNKGLDQGIALSNESINLDDKTGMILGQYILGQIVSDGYYEFWHESDLSLNEIYTYVKNCFENDSSFIDASKNIARHLYSCSIHPRIKSGELCIVYFKNVIVDTITCNAIGLFKSENKDTFLKMIKEGSHTEIITETGININKIDKAAVVFNTKTDSGYWVAVIDKTNKASEAKYWTDDFLKVRLCRNSYNQTERLIAMTRTFVSQLPGDMSKSEKAVIVNRSMTAVDAQSVSINEYAMATFKNVDLAESFQKYLEKKSTDEGMCFDEEITISQQAVKKKTTTSITTVKLDQNFDIRIHGGEQMIEQGYDENRGLKYYKFYYREER